MSNPRPDPKKRKVLINHNEPYAKEIVECFKILENHKMLTEKNLLAVTGNPENASKVTEGLQYLESKSLISLINVTAVAQAGKYAKDLAQAYFTLNTLGVELTKDVRDVLDNAGVEIPLIAGSILTSYADKQSKDAREGIGKLADGITRGVHELEDAGKLTVNNLVVLIEKEKTGNDKSLNTSKKSEVDTPLSFFSSAPKKSSNDARIAPQAGVAKSIKPAR